eukprot:231144_1
MPSPDLKISSIFVGIFTFICSLLTIILIFQLFCDKKNKQINYKAQSNIIPKLLIFLCVIVSTICEYADLTRHLICYVEHKDLYYYPLNNIMFFADFLYYLGSILFYIIAISKLQISFHGSQYSISCIIMSFFYILIGCALILAGYYSIVVYISPNNNNNSNNDYWAKHDTIPMISIG